MDDISFLVDLQKRIEENHGKMIFLNYQSSVSRFLMCIPHPKTADGTKAYNDYCENLTKSFEGKYGVNAHQMYTTWEDLESWQKEVFINEAKSYVLKIQDGFLS